jgi:hypothetical protein
MKSDLGIRRRDVGRRRTIVATLAALVLGSMISVVEALECPAVVVGTNDPAIDVPGVQQAVDECASVTLQGNFSFDVIATGIPFRIVTVSRSVNITGQPNDQGQLPVIVGGESPFLVDAPGAVVRIRALRFIRPVARAIRVVTALEVLVANCVVEALERKIVGDFTVGFGVVAEGTLEAPINRLIVVDNKIGDPSDPIEVGMILEPKGRVIGPKGRVIGSTRISRNEIHATTHGVDLRTVGGQAQIDHNRISIANSSRSGDRPTSLVDGIRCLGAGACSILSNHIESQHPNSSAIRLQTAAGVVVEDNDIQMTVPDGLETGVESSGVQLIEGSQRNLVGRNQVSGAARTAISVAGADNVFVLNRHPGFVPTLVDTEIVEGSLRTVVVGETGSVSDLGTGSVLR